MTPGSSPSPKTTASKKLQKQADEVHQLWHYDLHPYEQRISSSNALPKRAGGDHLHPTSAVLTFPLLRSLTPTHFAPYRSITVSDEGDEDRTEAEPRRYLQHSWTSRDHRKHRHVWVSPRPSAMPRYAKSIWIRIIHMATRLEWWNIGWWVAQAFTWGSVIWCINGFVSLLPVLYPSEFGDPLNSAGWTAWAGATVFEIGSVFGMWEAWNRDDVTAFGANVIRVGTQVEKELGELGEEVERGVERTLSNVQRVGTKTLERTISAVSRLSGLYLGAPIPNEEAETLDDNGKEKANTEHVDLEAGLRPDNSNRSHQPKQNSDIAIAPTHPPPPINKNNQHHDAKMNAATKAPAPTTDTPGDTDALDYRHRDEEKGQVPNLPSSSGGRSSQPLINRVSPPSKMEHTPSDRKPGFSRKRWIWFSTDTKYFREFGFLAAFFQMMGASIFWISGFTALPAVQEAIVDRTGVLDGIFWVPQIVGGMGFVISSSFIMLETQKRWYKPEVLSLGWHVGFWNFVGGVGFTACGALGLGAKVNSGVEFQSILCTFWGSWAFLIGSVIQWYESVNTV